MASTTMPWCGFSGPKLYLASGGVTDFEVTTKASRASLPNGPTGIGWDGTNTPWCGSNIGNDKVYIQSGQFESTIKDSVAHGKGPSTSGAGATGDLDTIFAEGTDLFILSGQVTGTVKDSAKTIPAANSAAVDDTNTPYALSGSTDKLVLLSGQVTETVKTSEDVTTIESFPTGCTYDGADTPWIGSSGDKYYATSGQFTGTLKFSISVSAVEANASEVEVGNHEDRLGLASSAFWTQSKVSSFAFGMVSG